MSAAAIAGAARAQSGGLRRFASQEALLALAVIGLAVVVGSLLADVAYAVADPRVRYS